MMISNMKIATGLALLFSVLVMSSCGTKRQSLYSRWGQQLNDAPTEKRTIDDISMLLGTPPNKCVQIEPNPGLGILVQKTQLPIVLAVRPNSPAFKAGIQKGEMITNIDTVSIGSVQDFKSAMLDRAKWGNKVAILTNARSYEVTFEKPTESLQCYWDISGGTIGTSRGGAYVDRAGGFASENSAAYQRIFRASCRFYDGQAIGCQSNWQE